MSRPFTARIIRYDDKRGLAGKLKGLITFTDGKSLKVWDDDLHRQCQQLAQFPVVEVTYAFKHSDKWGDALAVIHSTKADHELYDDARARDEARGCVKPNSYLGQRIAKGVRTIDPETPTPAAEISQVNALPPIEKGAAHR